MGPLYNNHKDFSLSLTHSLSLSLSYDQRTLLFRHSALADAILGNCVRRAFWEEIWAEFYNWISRKLFAFFLASGCVRNDLTWLWLLRQAQRQGYSDVFHPYAFGVRSSVFVERAVFLVYIIVFTMKVVGCGCSSSGPLSIKTSTWVVLPKSKRGDEWVGLVVECSSTILGSTKINHKDLSLSHSLTLLSLSLRIRGHYSSVTRRLQMQFWAIACAAFWEEIWAEILQWDFTQLFAQSTLYKCYTYMC